MLGVFDLSYEVLYRLSAFEFEEKFDNRIFQRNTSRVAYNKNTRIAKIGCSNLGYGYL